MQKLLILGLWLRAIAFVALMARWGPADQAAEKLFKPWGKAVQGVRLRVIAPKQLGTHEPIVCGIQLFNGSKTTISLLRSAPMRAFRLKLVESQSGQAVPLTRFGKFFSMPIIMGSTVPHRRIESRKPFSQILHLNRNFDMSRIGDYRLRVSLAIKELGIRVDSNEVTVRVRNDRRWRREQKKKLGLD